MRSRPDRMKVTPVVSRIGARRALTVRFDDGVDPARAHLDAAGLASGDCVAVVIDIIVSAAPKARRAEEIHAELVR